MFQHIVDGNMSYVYDYIIVYLAIIMVSWLFVVIANTVDFISGRSCAKAIGEALNSKGYRRTFAKIKDYYQVLIFFLMFDIMACLLPFYKLPFSSLIASLAIIAIECKSVIEHKRKKKSHAADVPDIIRNIVQCATSDKAQEILDKIVELTKNKEPNK